MTAEGRKEGAMRLRPGKPEEAGMSPRRLEGIVDEAEKWIAQGLTQALVLLVARRGVVVLHEAFGRLIPDADGPPVQRDTIYPVRSLTKPITATAVMALVEDGLLGLQRPLSEYIPEFAGEGKDAVMVHHLLTHTSGLSDEVVVAHRTQKKPRVSIPAPEPTQHPRINEVLWLGYDVPLWKAPGQEMSYSNFGYTLLGEVVRRVSGRSLADFARDRIFGPLGMEDTFYIVPDSVRARIVRRSMDAPGAVGAAVGGVVFPGLGSREDQDLPHAAWGVYSTVMDLAIFGQMFLNGGCYGDVRILSPAAVAEMTRNQIPGISSRIPGEFFPEASWGLGWSIHGNKKALRYASLHSPQAYYHHGAFGVQFWVDPVYEIVGLYFSVALERIDDLRTREYHDLFMNAATAAVEDV
jgi:CubicO group peptidase (beta-lactamase class C family)